MKKREEYSHVGFLYTRHGNSKPLQLPSTQLPHLPIQHFSQLKLLAHQLLVIKLRFWVKHLSDGHDAFDCSRNVIYILGLDESFEVVLEDFCKVVLQFGTAKVFQDFLPVWRVLFKNMVIDEERYRCSMFLRRIDQDWASISQPGS